jgi:MFS family permease
MASLMLLGAKLGDVWGRRRAFVIGAIIYACGSLLTALSPNIVVLFLGWSVIEGVGAVLVIPAIAALIASNYQGQDRVTGFAIIGATSGAAVALGPLIGGYVTTYLSWRYVFVGEVVVMAAVVAFSRLVPDSSRPQRIKIDIASVLLSATGLILIVLAMLQSKTWGWILPKQSPEIGGVPINPLGLSLVPYMILAGGFLLWAFFARQEALIRHGLPPLVHVSMLSIKQLRSGLSVLAAQYMITAGLFFMIPVYLQMTLGLNALDTGIKIFPLSISLILFSVVGTRLTAIWSPRRIIRLGQLVLVVSSFVLLGSVSLELRSVLFAAGMFFAGAALGLLASQIGNVTMSSVGVERSSEIGGLQGIFQNLGSSLGTALIGSVLIASLSSSFLGAVDSSDLPSNVKDMVVADTQAGVNIVPVSTVNDIATSAGLSADDAATLTTLYSDSQVSSLRASMVALVFIASLSLLFSKNIPTELVRRKPTDQPEEDPASSSTV